MKITVCNLKECYIEALAWSKVNEKAARQLAEVLMNTPLEDFGCGIRDNAIQMSGQLYELTKDK